MLGGVDLIVDPHGAIIFLSLFTLSARCDAYTERVSQQSWKFSRLLVIFKADPEQCSKQSIAVKSPSSELYTFTLPIVKDESYYRGEEPADCQLQV